MRTKYYKAYYIDQQGNKHYLCGENNLYDTIRGIKCRLSLQKHWLGVSGRKWHVEEYCLCDPKEVEIIEEE